MEDVAKYAERIIVMNHAKVQYDGEPKEIFKHYKELEKIGLAAPQVTYLGAAVREKGLAFDEKITTVAEAVEELKALLHLNNGGEVMDNV